MTTLSKQLRRVGATTTATVLMFAGSALGSAAAFAADTTTVPLKDAHKGAAATAFAGGSECSGYNSSQTLWHFVVPALDASPNSTGPNIIGIAATFNAGSVDNWVFVQNGKGVNVFTTGATNVNDATATLDSGIDESDAVLVLSHTCVGSGTTGGDNTGGTSGGSSSGGSTSGGSTSGGSTSGGSTSGGSTSGGSTSGGSTSGGSTSGGSTSGGSTSGGDGNGGGNTSGGDGNGNGNGGGNGNADTSVPVVTAGAPVVTTPAAPAAPTATVPDASVPVATAGGTEGAGTLSIDGAPAATGQATSAATGAASDATSAPSKALPFTGAPVGLLLLYAFGALLAGGLMLAGTRRRELAAAAGLSDVPSPAVVPAAVVPTAVVLAAPAYAPTVLPAPAVYRGRHVRPSTTGVVLLVLVSASLLAARSRRT